MAKFIETAGANSAASSNEETGPSSGSETDADIGQSHTTKSRKTLKRKRRATSPSRFGAALESLLDTNAPDGVPAPLSLKPGVARRQKEEKLERSARKILDGERKEREEKSRVRDVIGEWGMENERGLRKVAQRGVITLFNAIRESQASAEEAHARIPRGTGKPTLPAPDPDRNDRTKKRAKPNAIGKGREDNREKERFLEMIRAGGIVSKS